MLGMGLREAVGGVRESVSRRETGWRACVQACVRKRWSASTKKRRRRGWTGEKANLVYLLGRRPLSYLSSRGISTPGTVS